MKKIISFIPLALVAVLAFFGYRYAANQSTTMRMLVDARTGLTSDPAGIVLVNKNLETEAATVAKKRAEALKKNEEALLLARRAVEDMEAAQSALESSKGDLESIKEKIAEAEQTSKQVEEENNKMLDAMHSVPLLADASPEDANSRIEEYVKSYGEEYDKLKSDLDHKESERAKLLTEVSGLEVDLAERKAANERFMETYRKNGEEFVINAVDPEWHFVVFSAGNDSGLFPGDATKLLVHRNGAAITTLRVVSVSGGQIVAEYDEKTLPHGVQLEVGDRIFRQKPLGS